MVIFFEKPHIRVNQQNITNMKTYKNLKTRKLIFTTLFSSALFFAGCGNCIECEDCNVMGMQLEGATDQFEGKWCESDFNSKAEWKAFQKQAENMCKCD